MMLQATILGTGSYLPERVVANSDLGPSLHLSPEAIYRRTGIRTRRWAAEGEATSTLAWHAARRACEAAKIDPISVDAIIVSTTSPDTIFPSTACHLQQRMGCKGAAAFDVGASCAGFLYGLSMADRLIRSRQFRCCLVVAAEIKSRYLDPEDEPTALLFGDGAGAAVVAGESGDGPVPHGILGVRLAADGTRHDLIRVPAGGSREPATPETVKAHRHVLRMKGGPLYRVVLRRMTEAVRDMLKEFGLTMEQVDHLILHQANGRLLVSLAKRLNIPPAKLFTVIEKAGNTSSASLPLTLDAANREGRLRAGDTVLLGAFGGGLAWGTALVRW
jgi:3-oxoacyl-[acyl-carrier-protein] synthase-3